MIETVKFSSLAKFIMLFQLFTDVAVLLNIMYVRQIVGFIYLTFIPGFVVLKALKWRKKGFFETVLFSVGLSIALLMFLGSLVNESSPFMGFKSPLTMLPLLGMMNIVVIMSCFFGHIKDANVALSNPVKVSGTVLSFLPVLSIAGAFLINNFQDNSLSLLMILIIAGLIVSTTIYKKFPTELLPIALLLIAIALLFHGSLISNHLVGWDIHSEYHVFKSVDNREYWNSTLSSSDERIAKGNSMLSVTILPTIYSKIIEMDAAWIFKILYPLIFSFESLALYLLFCTQIKGKASFLSVFLVMSNLTFFEPDGLVSKQLIAELFLVLLFLVLNEKMNSLERNCLFAVFSAALVVSHYSVSYIFLFTIAFAWMYYFFLHHQRNIAGITLDKVLLYCAISFSWYIFTSSSGPFSAILRTGDHITRSFFLDFFNPSARSATVLRGLGAAEAVSVGHQIGRIFFYATEFFTVLGFLISVLKKRKVPFTEEYILFCFVFVTILGLSIIVPRLAGSFRMERFYHIALLVLAPLTIFGGETFFRFLLKRKNEILALNLVLIILIPNFLFETNFIYEITDDVSYYLPFAMLRGKEWRRIVLWEQEVYSAKWLSIYLNSSNRIVYADAPSTVNILTSYGMLTSENLRPLSNTTNSLEKGAYIYLRLENNLDGTVLSESYSWNTSDIARLINNQNKIYSNGASEIFEEP